MTELNIFGPDVKHAFSTKKFFEERVEFRMFVNGSFCCSVNSLLLIFYRHEIGGTVKVYVFTITRISSF